MANEKPDNATTETTTDAITDDINEAHEAQVDANVDSASEIFAEETKHPFVEEFVEQITGIMEGREVNSEGGEGGGDAESPEATATPDGEEADGDAEATEPPTPSPAATSDEQPADSPDDQGPSAEDLAAGQQALAWFRSLQPEALHAIDLLLSGQYQLTPIANGNVSPQTPAVASSSPTAGEDLNDDDDDYLDPRAKREIERVRAEVAQLKAAQEEAIRAQQSEQEREYTAIAAEVNDDFAAQYSLTPSELDKVMGTAVRLGVIGSYMQETGGDYKAALTRTYETALYSDPELRAKAIAPSTPSVEDTSPPPPTQQQIDAVAHDQMVARRRRAGAVSSGGGSAPRTSPTTGKTRTQLMAEEIAAARGEKVG